MHFMRNSECILKKTPLQFSHLRIFTEEYFYICAIFSVIIKNFNLLKYIRIHNYFDIFSAATIIFL